MEGWGKPQKGRIYKVFDPGRQKDPAVAEVKRLLAEGFVGRTPAELAKLLEHADDTFKVYLQFYKESPRHVSFNTLFEVHDTRIDATHSISRAISVRIAELEHPDQPDSSEFPVGQGHGYLWRLNNYWRLEQKDGGVYVQVETIALSRDVPAIFAWFVNPLIRRVSRHTVANLLTATRRGLVNSAMLPVTICGFFFAYSSDFSSPPAGS